MQSNDRASLSSTHGQVMFWNKSLILIHILDGRQRKWNLHFWSGNLLNVFRLRVALVVNPRFQWQFFVPFRFECQKLVLVGDPKVSRLNNLFYGRGPGDPAFPPPPYFSPNWGPKDRKTNNLKQIFYPYSYVFSLHLVLVVNPRFQWQFFFPFRLEC